MAVVLRQQQLRGEGEAFALVCGSAINQDGRSSGLTAPNGPSQTALVRCGLQYIVDGSASADIITSTGCQVAASLKSSSSGS